ncbi:putative phage tail protein [uncultured Herbaspirillum sp.]|jgi:uncharacterized protein YmfQ (DUF2313 family)|uniref:YmfQ family protein n=1 Tax=uncultured Herbaspirillum sp. TaxID=160236 RepID=UPI00262B61C4|nr:putative phage tail protein [uncultured Herbaspirillum sp.]
MNSHAELLKLLVPPVSYDRNGLVLSAELEAIGGVLDDFQDLVTALLRELDPRAASILLPEWETTYGLPDSCYAADDTLVDRRLRLASKVAAIGGISAPYFLDLAVKLGYTDVSIQRFLPTTCEASCEDQLLDSSWLFAWQVTIPGQQTIHRVLSAESSCDEPLDAYKQGPLECLLLRLSPPESVLLFNYGEPQ